MRISDWSSDVCSADLYCPSGRLFEAAACGVPVVSDWWDGLDDFFTPDAEILIARNSRDVVAALDLPHSEIARIGQAARARVLDEHSSEHRARAFVALLRDPIGRASVRDRVL